MKAWLNFFKEHSKAIFRLKVAVLLIVNTTLVYLITMEMLLPYNFEIKGNWLDKVTTTGLGLFGYTIGGLGVSLNSVKLLCLLSMFIVLNVVVLYFSTVMFSALILYMMKTCNKIYTNFLINKENMYILGLRFEHKLTEAEKKEILDAVYTSKVKVNDTNLYEELYRMVMELNDKQAIEELIRKKIDIYMIELERKAQELSKLQESQNYDYVQGALDTVWSYMTPKNILIGIGIIGVTVFIIWSINGFTGASTTKLIDEVTNKGIDQMEKGVNSTEAAFETLQNQQKILIEDNISVHKEITNIYKELHNTNLSIINCINQTNKSIKDYIDPSENRSVETIKHLNQFILKTEDNIKTLFNNIKELDSRIEGVINSINLIRNILRHNENNQNQNDSDSESVLEVEE